MEENGIPAHSLSGDPSSRDAREMRKTKSATTITARLYTQAAGCSRGFSLSLRKSIRVSLGAGGRLAS